MDSTIRALLFDPAKLNGLSERPLGSHHRKNYDPGLIDDWARALPKDRKVVVYCVHGHEFGRLIALRLQAAGVDAGFLRGGFDVWKAAAQPLQSTRQEAP